MKKCFKWHFCFGSLVVLDVVFRYLSLFLLHKYIYKNGGFRCGVPLFIVILVT